MKLSVRMLATSLLVAKVWSADDASDTDILGELISGVNETINELMDTPLVSCAMDDYELWSDNQALETAVDEYWNSEDYHESAAAVMGSSEEHYTISYSDEATEAYKQACISAGGLWDALPDQTVDCTYDEAGHTHTVTVTTVNYGGCTPDSDACKTVKGQWEALVVSFTELMMDEGLKCALKEPADADADVDADADASTTSAAPSVGAFASASIAAGLAVAMVL